MAYQWNNPHEWLLEKARVTDNPAALFSVIQSLAGRLDPDSIEDLFQIEMDQDGYFEAKAGENQPDFVLGGFA